MDICIYFSRGGWEELGKRVFVPRVGEYVYSEKKGFNVKVTQVTHSADEIRLEVEE